MHSMNFKNLIDYFVLCGLDIKNGLEAEYTPCGKTFIQIYFYLYLLKIKKLV